MGSMGKCEGVEGEKQVQAASSLDQENEAEVEGPLSFTASDNTSALENAQEITHRPVADGEAKRELHQARVAPL